MKKFCIDGYSSNMTDETSAGSRSERERYLIKELGDGVDAFNGQFPGATSKVKGPNRPVFGPLSRSFQNRVRTGDCFRRGCAEPAVASHVLARGSALKIIAEGNKVTGIALRSKNANIAHISLGEAHVTFPGFCREHEKDFWSFEQGTKGFTERSEETLQALRSTARESWVATGDRDWLRDCMRAYRQMISNEDLPFDEQVAWESRLVWPMLELIQLVDDKVAALSSLLDTLEDAVLRDEPSPSVVTRVFGQAPSIALSGSTVLQFFILLETGTKEFFDTVVVLTAIPEAGGTRIILCGQRSDALHAYSHRYLSDEEPDRILRAWMAATDFWFTSPAWWARRPVSEREELIRTLASL